MPDLSLPFSFLKHTRCCSLVLSIVRYLDGSIILRSYYKQGCRAQGAFGVPYGRHSPVYQAELEWWSVCIASIRREKEETGAGLCAFCIP